MTRHITPVLAGFLLVFATMTAAIQIGAASADPPTASVIAHPVNLAPVVAHSPAPFEGSPAVALAVAPAAAPTGSPAFVTVDQLHDPAIQPVEAWDDAKAARKLGWPIALLAALIMLARGIGSAGRNVPWLAWLNKGRAAVIVAGAGTVATAGFNTLGLGGTWFAVAMAAATAFFALISPTSGPAPAPSSTTTAATSAAAALLLVLLVGGAGATLPGGSPTRVTSTRPGLLPPRIPDQGYFHRVSVGSPIVKVSTSRGALLVGSIAVCASRCRLADIDDSSPVMHVDDWAYSTLRDAYIASAVPTL